MTAAEDRVIAFVFTDIETSTDHAQRFPEGMRVAHARHDEILKRTAATFSGHLFQSVGDGFKFAFADPVVAVQAALQAQLDLQRLYVDKENAVPLRVRMAIHAGMTEVRDGEYVGLTPAKAARLLEIIHGGQIVLTGETVGHLNQRLPDGATAQELGEFRLRDFVEPDILFQIAHRDLPAHFPFLRLTDAFPNNLPTQLSHLIGRTRETEEIRQRVMTQPLVTLTGAGGCGKTRLAIHVADRFLRKYPDGVWFIDLSPGVEPASVARAVAAVLGLTLDANAPLTRQISAYLSSRRCLLILDNCEHLIEAVATFVTEVLEACNNVRILATSRESLGVGGEALYPVRPLPVPPESARDPGTLMTYESVRLFCLRARLRSPKFDLSQENLFAVARICRLLDGIPLAVVLMASWSDAMSPIQMEKRMREKARFRFPLSSGDDRALPARHQTLRTTMNYSLDLLTEAERALLRRLAIFSGGFTLEAAEEVCGGDPVEDVLHSLVRLLRKSLVETEDTPIGKRYYLLHPIHEFGLELLREHGEFRALRDRHRQYFVAWSEEIGPQLFGADSRIAMAQIDTDIENFRSAFQVTGDTYDGLRLFSNLAWYWYMRGYNREGIAWGVRFLERDDAFPIDDSDLRANARNRMGILYQASNDLTAARRSFGESLAISRERGDREKIARCLSNMGMIAVDQRDYEMALRDFEEALTLYRELDDATKVATVEANIGAALVGQGMFKQGEERLLAALSFHRKAHNRAAIAFILINLAEVAAKEQNWRQAFKWLKECFVIRHEENHAWGMGVCLQHFARVADACGLPHSVLRFLVFSESLRGNEFTWSPAQQEENEELRRKAREAIPERDAILEETIARQATIADIVSELDALEFQTLIIRKGKEKYEYE